MQGSVTNRSRLILGVSFVLLIANIVGVFVYVSRASLGWTIPEEHRRFQSPVSRSFGSWRYFQLLPPLSWSMSSGPT